MWLTLKCAYCRKHSRQIRLQLHSNDNHLLLHDHAKAIKHILYQNDSKCIKYQMHLIVPSAFVPKSIQAAPTLRERPVAARDQRPEDRNDAW